MQQEMEWARQLGLTALARLHVLTYQFVLLGYQV